MRMRELGRDILNIKNKVKTVTHTYTPFIIIFILMTFGR
jgi:hypothetical protein